MTTTKPDGAAQPRNARSSTPKPNDRRAQRKGPRRAGWIVQRGENTWQVRIYTGRSESGTRHYETRTVQGNKADAEDALADLYKDKRRGVLASKRLTLGDLLDAVIVDYKLNGQRVVWATQVINKHIRPALGQVPISKLKQSQVTAYTARRVGKAANETVNHELSMIRRSFNLAVKQGVLAVPPFRIAKLKTDNVRKGFFEHSDYVRLRDHLPAELKPILTCGYFTGMRKGEILGLRWEQVDLIRRVIRLEPGETKNKAPRIIPLQVQELYESLSLLKKLHDDYFANCPFVYHRASVPITCFRDAWSTACKVAGGSLWDAQEKKPTRLFHDLRRSGVRNLIRAGTPEKVAMLISGHKTRSVLDRYNIVDERDLIDAMKRLDVYSRERQEKEAVEKRRAETAAGESPSGY